MSTYLNGYTLLEKLWIQLVGYNSNITAYTQGTDTTGPYSNPQIMDGINAAQRFIFGFLFKSIPYEFEEETALTGVSSVYTLPADFGVLRYFKDSDGYQIHPIGTGQRRLTSGAGSDQRYYRKGNTLVVDKASVTDVNTLTYYRKCRDIEQGKALGGGSQYLEFAATAKLIDDYYNGLKIENITDDSVDTILDYTATDRKATIEAEVGATDDYYGTVSDLPEPFHYLLIPRAVFEITANYPIAKEKPSVSGVDLFTQNLMATLKMYTGTPLDTYSEDLWTSYGSGGAYNNNPYNLPGHE